MSYYWKDKAGNRTDFTYSIGVDGFYHGYSVLRSGINGFSTDTKEITSAKNLNNMGEFLQNYGWNRRDGFGFRIAILGNGLSEIETKRKQLLSAMSEAGELWLTFADNSAAHITVDKVSMTVTDGLGLNPKVQYADISFTALNPYFYGTAVSRSGLSGDVTITNTGNIPAEVSFTLSANTVTRTRGSEVKTVSAVSGQSLSGTVLSVSDNSITAVQSSSNVMYKFALNSDFFGLESGDNVVNGISAYTYVPRWSAV